MHLAVNAFFWDRPDTGSGQYTRQLVTHLARLDPNLQITLIYPRIQAPPDDPLPPNCRWHPVPARPGNLGKVQFEQLSFPSACQNVQADLAHVPYWGSPLSSPVPIVVTIHDLIPLLLREYRGGLLGRLYTGLVAAAARGAQRVITDSFASKADIVTHLKMPDAKISAIHLAAGEAFLPGPIDPAVASRYQLPKEYILYLGGMDLRKNVVGLLHAYSYIGPAIGDQFPLVLAGRPPATPSPRFPNLRRLIEELGIRPYVHWTGFVQEADKPAIYRGATVLAQLSYYEGFGLTPLEAMACGTPVVVSDRSSLPEVVGEAGFTLDPEDIDGIAGAIIACAIQDELRSSLRRRGLDQAGRFSWQRTAGQTLQAFRQALTEA